MSMCESAFPTFTFAYFPQKGGNCLSEHGEILALTNLKMIKIGY